MKRIITLLLLIVMSNTLMLGQVTDGYIHFEVKFEDDGLSDQEKAMLPTEAEMWFSGEQMLMRMPSAMGMETKVLTRGDEMYILMDVFGNKMAIKSGKEEMKKSARKEKSFKVKTVTGETKTIAGYECLKAIMTAEDGEEMVVWFSKSLKVKSDWYYNMEGIDGFPLEFSTSSNGMKFKMIATEVKTNKPDQQLFVLPSDFKVMTQAEMQKMFGGMK
jgi:GLPGLI family protein